MTFDEARALFPVLERVAYLNAGTFGPLAQATVAAISEQLRRDLEQGRSGKPYIEEMQAVRATLRELIASLLASTPEHVSLTYSTTDACNIVLAGLGLRPDDEIVTTDSEHFGLAGPVFTSGATVHVARVQELGSDQALEAIMAEITPSTRLLAVSHVLWTTGVVLDVHALKERSGLPVLVDGAQSVGAIPVDVGALDYYTVSGQKWEDKNADGAKNGRAACCAAGDVRARVVRARRPVRPSAGSAAVRLRLAVDRIAQGARDRNRPRARLAVRAHPGDSRALPRGARRSQRSTDEPSGRNPRTSASACRPP